MKYIVTTEAGHHSEHSTENAAITAAKRHEANGETAYVEAWERSGKYRSKVQVYPVRDNAQSWMV